MFKLLNVAWEYLRRRVPLHHYNPDRALLPDTTNGKTLEGLEKAHSCGVLPGRCVYRFWASQPRDHSGDPDAR